MNRYVESDREKRNRDKCDEGEREKEREGPSKRGVEVNVNRTQEIFL